MRETKTYNGTTSTTTEDPDLMTNLSKCFLERLSTRNAAANITILSARQLKSISIYPTALRENPYYYKVYCVALNTLLASVLPLVALIFLNIRTVRALGQMSRPTTPIKSSNKEVIPLNSETRKIGPGSKLWLAFRQFAMSMFGNGGIGSNKAEEVVGSQVGSEDEEAQDTILTEVPNEGEEVRHTCHMQGRNFSTRSKRSNNGEINRSQRNRPDLLPQTSVSLAPPTVNVEAPELGPRTPEESHVFFYNEENNKDGEEPEAEEPERGASAFVRRGTLLLHKIKVTPSDNLLLFYC